MEGNAATLPTTGDVLLGKYRIVRVIGEGGMGVVFEALHEGLDQRVAIKVLRPEVAVVPEVVSRFAREARTAGKLGSRHTARILDIESHQGLPVMVMEFLVGHDLAEELEARGALPIEEAVGYVLAACVAMREAHALGIVHRDLKPSNLFLCEDRGERVVKVLDFGISKMVEANDVHLTSTSGTMGTPLYMSPEQVRSAKRVDLRTDIWSLGVILYELLSGELPFPGDNGPAVIAAIVADEPAPLRSLRPDVPEDLAAAVHTAIAKKPDARYPDAAAFAARLAPFGPASPSDRFAIVQPSAQVVSEPSSSRASDPSFVLAATQRDSPPVTDGTWSTDGARRGRSRTLLVAVALGIVVLASGVVIFAKSAASRSAAASLPDASIAAAETVTGPAPALAQDASPPGSAAPPPSSAEPAPAPVAAIASTASAAAMHAPRPAVKPSASAAKPPPPPPKPPSPADPAANPNRL